MDGVQLFIFTSVYKGLVNNIIIPVEVAYMIYKRTLPQRYDLTCKLCSCILLTTNEVDLSHSKSISIGNRFAYILRMNNTVGCLELYPCDSSSLSQNELTINDNKWHCVSGFTRIRHFDVLYSRFSKEYVQKEKYFTQLVDDKAYHFCYPCWYHTRRVREMFFKWRCISWR